ncbi:polysaccharide deacetylase family protein [Celerinatantimonas yamalensis]|uniref:Polysaccharide deacetylase family protein n=1 Tax=Celerinatantimonas yamalensis TaxID=559956 RepID=A0ABW9G463_9GAMM
MKQSSQTIVGLRVDVDTYRGARDGVPRLLKLFDEYQIHASFFFSVGPDNNGRQFWRLWHPAYFKRFIRTSFAGVHYHFNGALWRGPVIGRRVADIIQCADKAGHEVGLHAWDHHKWMSKTEQMSPLELRVELEKGYQLLSQVLGRDVECSAAAGWRCSEPTLTEKEAFPFRYNSDCRGKFIFVPAQGMAPQIPVTLPTYEELIGRHGITRKNYNQHILEQIKTNQLNVYNIHAEVEGSAQFGLFKQWLQLATEQQFIIVPLGALLDKDYIQWPKDGIVNVDLSGDDEWQSHQASVIQQSVDD